MLSATTPQSTSVTPSTTIINPIEKQFALFVVEVISKVPKYKATFLDKMDSDLLSALDRHSKDNPIQNFYDNLQDKQPVTILAFLTRLEELSQQTSQRSLILEAQDYDKLKAIKSKLSSTRNQVDLSDIQENLKSLINAFDRAINTKPDGEIALLYCLGTLREFFGIDIAKRNDPLINLLSTLIPQITPTVSNLDALLFAKCKNLLSASSMQEQSTVVKNSSVALVTDIAVRKEDLINLIATYRTLLILKRSTLNVDLANRELVEKLSCLSHSILTSAHIQSFANSNPSGNWLTLFNTEVDSKMLLPLMPSSGSNAAEMKEAGQEIFDKVTDLIKNNTEHLSEELIISNIANWIEKELHALSHPQVQPALSSSASSGIEPTLEDTDQDIDMVSSTDLDADCPEIELDMSRNFAILHKIAEEQLKQFAPAGVETKDLSRFSSSSSSPSVSAPSPSAPTLQVSKMNPEMRSVLSFWMSPYVNKLMISLRNYIGHSSVESDVKQTKVALHRLLETMQYATASLLQQPTVNIEVAHSILQGLLLNPLLRKGVSQNQKRNKFLTEAPQPVTTFMEIEQLKKLMDSLCVENAAAILADKSDTDKKHLVFHEKCMELLRFVLPFLLRKDQVVLPGATPSSIDKYFSTMVHNLHSNDKYHDLLAALNQCVIRTIKIIILNPKENVDKNIEKLLNLLKNIYAELKECGIKQEVKLPTADVFKTVTVLVVSEINKLRSTLNRKNNSNVDNAEIAQITESIAKNIISLYTDFSLDYSHYTAPQMEKTLLAFMNTTIRLYGLETKLGDVVANHDLMLSEAPESSSALANDHSASPPDSFSLSQPSAPPQSSSSTSSSSSTPFMIRRHRTPQPVITNDLPPAAAPAELKSTPDSMNSALVSSGSASSNSNNSSSGTFSSSSSSSSSLMLTNVVPMGLNSGSALFGSKQLPLSSTSVSDPSIPPPPPLDDIPSSSASYSPGTANPLLNAIQGFSKNGLKKTVTKDSSIVLSAKTQGLSKNPGVIPGSPQPSTSVKPKAVSPLTMFEEMALKTQHLSSSSSTSSSTPSV